MAKSSKKPEPKKTTVVKKTKTETVEKREKKVGTFKYLLGNLRSR